MQKKKVQPDMAIVFMEYFMTLQCTCKRVLSGKMHRFSNILLNGNNSKAASEKKENCHFINLDGQGST